MQVRAEDSDAGQNGEIEYSFAAQTLTQHGAQFGVRNSTGVVYVRGGIDYEQTSIFHLIVVARDRGPDAVAAETTVVVRVDDVNDNSPLVVASTLQHGAAPGPGGLVTGAGGPAVAAVVENSPAGMFVAHVSVTDADSGKNGRVNCTLAGGGTAFRLVHNYDTEYQVISDRYTVRLSVRPLVCLGHDHSGRGIESQGHRLRSKVNVQHICAW